MPTVEYRGMRLIVPENDMEFLGYYEAARQHKLVMKQCSACNLMRFPPGSGCPWCMSLDWTWQEVSGKGTIYSYEIIVHAIQPGFKEIAPYAVIVVELDEQRGVPTWLELDKVEFKGIVHQFPARDQLTIPIQEQLIVELYSK